MNHDQNALIRYLMNEMDPSEARLFEKELQDHPNERIDYEALKTARDRVADLPIFSAPQALLADVSAQARRSAMARRSRIYQKRFMQAAAVVLVLVGSSSVMISQSDLLRDPERVPSSASKETRVAGSSGSSPWIDRDVRIRFGGFAQPQSGSSAAAFQASSGQSPAGRQVSTGRSAADPLQRGTSNSQVDLRALHLFTTRGQADPSNTTVPVDVAEHDSIYRESFQKLRLLHSLDSPQSILSRDLQLTGSRP